MRFASTDGVQVAVHELGGRPDGPVLLFAHANGFHGRCYQPLVDAGLGRRFRCVGLDFRGHGDSSAPGESGIRWYGLGDDVLAVVDGLGAEPGTVRGLGHSFGGAGLLMAEVVRPGTFAGLWVFEPIVPPPGAFVTPPGGDNPMAATAERRREVFDSYEAAIANFGSKPPMQSFAPEALKAYVEGGFAEQPDGTVRIKCRGATEAAFYRTSSTNHIFERLGEVQCPVTVAIGTDADFGPAAFGRPAAEALPHGTVRAYPQLDHFGPFQAPVELAGDAATDLP